MLGNNFRPWGPLRWILSRLPQNNWDLIGCLSPEARCLGVLYELNGRMSSSHFYKIIDPPSRFSELLAQLISKNEAKMICKGVPASNIVKYDLLVRYGAFVDDLNTFLVPCNN